MSVSSYTERLLSSVCWVCGESWLAIRLFNPLPPVLKAGHPGFCSHVVLCGVDMLCVCVILVCDGGGGNSFLFFLWLVCNKFHATCNDVHIPEDSPSLSPWD